MVTVPERAPLSGRRVLVGPDVAGGPHLFTVGDRSSVADLVPRAEVSPDVVAVPGPLAEELGLDGGGSTDWRCAPVTVAQAHGVTLELPTERAPDDVVSEIARAGLVGALVPTGPHECWLPVADVPFRVRSVDTGGVDAVAARIGPGTEVDLHAGANRVGVDIVILADCSGSMTIDDIPRSAVGAPAGSPAGWLRRVDALHIALRELLAVRRQVAGRTSHLSLMRFDEQAHPHFPRTEGMALLDGGSSDGLIAEFEQAVESLVPGPGRTDIGRALHRAAEVLHRHGRRDNEKLIVLVSDGADWRPTGEDAVGTVVDALDEPVSLMEHLHRTLGVRLQAVGISTPELFRRRGTYVETRATLPDHGLLRELVAVAGGDRAAVGGLDVLRRCVAGLGAGVTHRVVEPRSAAPDPDAPLHPDTLAALAAPVGPPPAVEARARDHLSQLAELAVLLASEAQRICDGPLWVPAEWATALPDWGRVAVCAEDLRRFLDATTGGLAPADHVLDRIRCPELVAWVGLLGELDAWARGGADPAELVRLCRGTPEPLDPAEIQLLVMTTLLEALAELHRGLGRVHPTRRDPPPDVVYRD